ncbi:MAG TPA: pilus assembly protein TadG-related protein [Caulobacteraceae bacterium]|jgi:Flp pilus assembly protein TadG
MKLLRQICSALAGFRSEQSGVTAPIIAIAFTALVGATGYAVDMGHVAWVQRQLQASADAAALAGALYVATDVTTATSAANTYSGAAGQNNAIMGASSVNTNVQPHCFTTVTSPVCTPTSGTYNGIVVTQTASVPTYFVKIFGINSMTPTATASASAKGGAGTALNVMVVLDTTASMQDRDSNCSGGSTKIACAQAGAAALLNGLTAGTSTVGFMTYPPVDSKGVTNDTTCNGGTLGGSRSSSGSVQAYNQVSVAASPLNYSPSNSATYTLADLGSPASTIVTTLVGTNNNCKGQGIQAVGGVGTFFGDAVTAAQYQLQHSSNAVRGAQNVIVILSDGDAGATSANVGASKYADQCKQAVTAAQAAATAGMWVFTVAYGANSYGNSTIANPAPTTTKGTPSTTTKNGTTTTTETDTTTTITNSNSNAGCAQDVTTPISPCDTMKNMASDPMKFYSDGASTSSTPQTTTTTQPTTTTTTTTTGRNGKTTTDTTTGKSSSSTKATGTSTTTACTGTGGTSSDLVTLFRDISASLTMPRLIPNGTI